MILSDYAFSLYLRRGIGFIEAVPLALLVQGWSSK